MTALTKIIEYLETREVPIVKSLKKGLTVNEIWKLPDKQGLEPTSEVEKMFQITNGTTGLNISLGLQYLFPGYILCPLETAIELYQEECIDGGLGRKASYRYYGMEIEIIYWLIA